MSRILLALCLVAATTPSLQAESPDTSKVAVVPKLEPGARFSFLHHHALDERSGSDTSTKSISDVPITVEVIGRAGDGWLLERREGLAVVGGEALEPPLEALVKSVVAARSGLGLRFEVDADGRFKRLVDVESFARQVRERSALPPDPSGNPDLAMLTGMMLEVVTDPRFIEEQDGVALEALFTCSGVQLSPGGSQVFEQTSQGDPDVVGSKIRLLAAMPASDEKTVTVTLSSATQGKGDAAAMAAGAESMGLPAEIGRAMAAVDFAFGHEARCVISRETLMPMEVQSAVSKTTGSLTKIRREEFKSIAATPDPAPPRSTAPDGK